MGYVLKAVLSSAQHPEYGQITVPFPIPDEKYDRMIELLEPLEIGDALRQDCRVDELDSFYTVLNRLVGSLVNFDELDYLAKRLDSFDDGEAAQFQGMACKLGVSNIKDFINLTFCCQQATVITDFSDLDAIGRQHYMTMQGGGCRIEELERLDGRKFALDLILNHLEGRITPYGVVYDIINLPHPTSAKHPRMPLSDRAAQFAPFAALSGHSAALAETARLTDQRMELDEDARAALDLKQQLLLERIKERPEITATWFQPDEKKDGGRYIVSTGRLKRIHEADQVLILADGLRIPIGDIVELESECIRGLL